MIVDSVEGSFTNVVGLPLERLQEELIDWGFVLEKIQAAHSANT
jgi:predicted house-cleaning NTP pyrophosphatase (Maf/HAM1 superfamily)